MSNLGKIFEINYKAKIKRMYPIVYKNKSYYYCKVNGSDTLISIPTVEAVKSKTVYTNKKVISLKDYKESIVSCPDSDFIGYVYLNETENYFFNELKYDVLTNKLTNVKDKIRQLEFFISSNIQRIKSYEKENIKYANEIKTLEIEKLELEEKILARNKKAVANNGR